LEIAEKLRIPAYVLGAFGGAAEQAGRKSFKNPFLSLNEKESILSATSISFLPSSIIRLLERDRFKIYLYNRVNKILQYFFK
jgi:hypothetical protein